MKKDEIVLVGAGGHCKAAIDVIEAEGRYSIAGYVDFHRNEEIEKWGYSHLGCDEDLVRLVKAYRFFLITVGQTLDGSRRRTLYHRTVEAGADFPVIVSPLARVARNCEIGRGTVIMHFSLVNAGARVGENVIVNNGALVEHDARIGSHVHVATCAVLNGCSSVGETSLVGSGAIVIQNIKIGEGCVLGAGAVATKNLLERGVYAGAPAVFKRPLL